MLLNYQQIYDVTKTFLDSRNKEGVYIHRATEITSVLTDYIDLVHLTQHLQTTLGLALPLDFPFYGLTLGDLPDSILDYNAEHLLVGVE